MCVVCFQGFAENKQKRDVFDDERSEHIENNAVNLIQLEGKDVKIEKLMRLKNRLMTFYTVSGDDSNLYVLSKTLSSHSSWETDTIALKTRDSLRLTTHNLSIFKVKSSSESEYIKIFCGEDYTYEVLIRNTSDFDKPFSRVSDYYLGKIKGVYFDKGDWKLNVYFCGSSESLINKNAQGDKYLYRMSQDNNYNVWSDPIFVSKHNRESFANYSFARKEKGKTSTNYSIMSFENDRVPYYSNYNNDTGVWEYAIEMDEKITGHNHKVFIGNNIVYVMFFRKIENDILNDMYIWYGRLKDFEKGCKGGDLLKVTDNVVYGNLTQEEKMTINSSMNADIVIKKNKIMTTISAKWMSYLPCYALKVEILEKRIVPYI
ncbi:MAG: hypothetical protein R3Y51_01675 [Rikenellaceae bacterium]